MTWLETMKQSQLLHGMGKTGFYRTCFKLQEAHLQILLSAGNDEIIAITTRQGYVCLSLVRLCKGFGFRLSQAYDWVQGLVLKSVLTNSSPLSFAILGSFFTDFWTMLSSNIFNFQWFQNWFTRFAAPYFRLLHPFQRIRKPSSVLFFPCFFDFRRVR